jgi:glutamate synthase domain-containing protein 1
VQIFKLAPKRNVGPSMCGIVGLFLKDDGLQPRLGGMLAPMLGAMSDRGPDSAGFAVYGAEDPGNVKITLRAPDGFDFAAYFARLQTAAGDKFAYKMNGSHAVVSVPHSLEATLRATIKREQTVSIVGTGRRMEIFKEVGRPDLVAQRFNLSEMSGSHAIGHTRMATESAVTTAGAHPFTTGADQCLVHNGSLSNHNELRRKLTREGFEFETDNDSEVAAAYLTSAMKKDGSLDQALRSALEALDGFFTFVVANETGFGVLRDPVGCKPAVMAETNQWVAFGTEYRALVELPDIDSAHVWEPEPARVYLWERA